MLASRPDGWRQHLMCFGVTEVMWLLVMWLVGCGCVMGWFWGWRFMWVDLSVERRFVKRAELAHSILSAHPPWKTGWRRGGEHQTLLGVDSGDPKPHCQGLQAVCRPVKNVNISTFPEFGSKMRYSIKKHHLLFYCVLLSSLVIFF